MATKESSCAGASTLHSAPSCLSTAQGLSKFMTLIYRFIKTSLVLLQRFCKRLLQMGHLRDFSILGIS